MSDEDSDKEGDGEEDGKHKIEDELFDDEEMDERRSIAPREPEEPNEFGNLDEESDGESGSLWTLLTRPDN